MIVKVIGGLIIWLLPIFLVFPAALPLVEQEATQSETSIAEILPFNESRAFLENELNTVDRCGIGNWPERGGH
jgi:hypothetical protein